MNRKKVKTDNTLNIEPKKREEEVVKSSPITFLSNDDKIKWEKIKNVNGKIVRVKEGESIKRKELLEKKNTVNYMWELTVMISTSITK